MRGKVAKILRRLAEDHHGSKVSEREYQEQVRGNWIQAKFGRLFWKEDDDGNMKKDLHVVNETGTVVCRGARALYLEYKKRYKRGDQRVLISL